MPTPTGETLTRSATRPGLPRLALFAVAMAVVGAFASEPAKKVTYEDDVLPIFRDNCLKCHNPDKLKGDLDLTSFSSAIKGGGSGSTLNAGDPDGSQLFRSIMHSDEPNMPPNAKLSDANIAIIRQWIEGGLLQGVNSKALSANKPAQDLALKSVSVGKPDGPPPMPANLALDPVIRASHASALGALASSPWAPLVALGAPHELILYDTNALEYLGVLPFPEGMPCDVKFSRNGKLLLAGGGRGGHSGSVAVWDITTGQRVITIGDQFDSVLAADLSADQQWIALGGPDRVLKIYRTKDGGLEHRRKKHTEWVTALEFSPDSKYLASGDRNGGLVVWEADTGQELFNLTGHKGGITAITWRADSAMVASASEDGTIKLWKAADGSALRSIPAHPGGTLAARFTHDGRIVSGGRDNKVDIWDTNGKKLSSLPFKGDLPHHVTFNDDGTKVIASDWSGAVYVWDARTAKLTGNLDSTPAPVSERAAQGVQRVAKLKAELKAAETAAETAAHEVSAAQSKLDAAKEALTQARATLTAQGGMAIKASEQVAADPQNQTAQKQLADARALVDSFPARISALQKGVTVATQKLNAATRKSAEAKAAVTEIHSRLSAAQASLARWQSALQREPVTAARKVSRR